LISKLILFFFLSAILFAQSEFKRWEKVEENYLINKLQRQNYNYSFDVISGLQIFYKTVISDLDGDNCPFEPSCSNFFVQAYKETNLIQASLMFADRFMRDTNIFNRDNYLPNANGKRIDPIDNYE